MQAGGGGKGRLTLPMGESRRQQPSAFRSLLGQAQSHPSQTPELSMQRPLPAPAQGPLEHRSLKRCPSLLLTPLQAQASPRSAPITPIPTHASGTLLLVTSSQCAPEASTPTLASVPSHQSGAHAEEAAGASWGKGVAYPGRKSRGAFFP